MDTIKTAAINILRDMDKEVNSNSGLNNYVFDYGHNEVCQSLFRIAGGNEDLGNVIDSNIYDWLLSRSKDIHLSGYTLEKCLYAFIDWDGE